MVLVYRLLPTLACITFISVRADTSANESPAPSPDSNPDLFNMLFGRNPQRFDKQCNRIFKALSNGTETVSVADYNRTYAEYQARSQLPKDIAPNLNEIDTDKNGEINSTEFCSEMQKMFKTVHTKDFEKVEIQDEVFKAQLKKSICKFRETFPSFGKTQCEISSGPESSGVLKKRSWARLDLSNYIYDKKTLTNVGAFITVIGILIWMQSVVGILSLGLIALIPFSIGILIITYGLVMVNKANSR